MTRADSETTHLKILGTISQGHVISQRLARSNVTREEKQIGQSHCQLARLACVLLHSEKQSMQKNIGDVLCFHSMFVAARFQL